MSTVGSAVGKAAHWPPLVYFLLAVIGASFWAGGTSIEVLTSEAWIGHYAVGQISLAPFGQIFDFVRGALPNEMLVPFCFGWGTQLALIFASTGIELPRHPAWRYWGAWGLILLLLGINSCGDWQYAQAYGGWAQTGFTVVVLFLTFFVGLLTIIAFKHGWEVLQHG